MKKQRMIILMGILAVLWLPPAAAGGEGNSETALLLIDIQDFYFPGGRSELVAPEAAGMKAADLLRAFRKKGLTVVHVRHHSDSGAGIHRSVRPAAGEKVITKRAVNSFKDTDLLDYLRNRGITDLVVCGMMTHMCVEAAVRAARDFGFECLLIHDACATKALKFGEHEISADAVHFSTLSTLSRTYAEVMDAAAFLDSFQ